MKEYDAYINMKRLEEAKSKVIKSKTGIEYLQLIIRIYDEPDSYGNDLSIRVKTIGGEKFIFLGNGKEIKPYVGKNDDELP